MFRPALLVAALALPTLAHAAEPLPGESNDEVVIFEGKERLFKGVEQAYGLDLWDEGVGIYAKADVASDLSFIMEGMSELEWPEVLVNSWNQTERGGQITIKNKGAVFLEITGEIFGVKLGYELWREEVDWTDTFELRSLLLEGTRQGKTVTLTATGDNIVDFEEEFEVWEDTLYITVNGKLQPVLNATVNGLAIEVDQGSVNSTDGTMLVEPPEVNEGEVEFDATWVGDVKGEMGFRVIPTVTVKVGSLSVGPLQYPLDIDIFSDTVSLESDRSLVVHDLPSIQAGARTLDFGQVTLGESSTREFVVQNLGNVELEGYAVVDGDGFVMEQETILVARTNDGPATEQAFEIDFLPTAEGTFSGTLIVTTNDPVQPELRIPMAGVGVNPADDPGTGDPNDPGSGDGLVSQPHSGCGCNSTTPAGGLGALMALGLVGLVTRRRRNG